ncbi:hypothetical protein ILUMI_21256 [Ignelater luminosus]|uniref:Transposase n=1 Tax=Ignelater luminosus TaxID=2038154 RepID=A0A8K0G1K8_IGNLU|nr:hypothetical protein ILUMI_21256 [Ignelater luminosus]
MDKRGNAKMYIPFSRVTQSTRSDSQNFDVFDLYRGESLNFFTMAENKAAFLRFLNTKRAFPNNDYYGFKKGFSAYECKESLNLAFQEQAPSLATMYRWSKEFERKKLSVKHQKGAGRPPTTVTEDKIAAIARKIENDNKATYVIIEHQLKIGSSAVRTIIHDHLHLKRIPLSETHWKSRIKAINSLYHQIGEVYDSLEQIANDGNRDANMAHKLLQNAQVNIHESGTAPRNLNSYITQQRSDESFENFVKKARELGKDLKVECEFRKSIWSAVEKNVSDESSTLDLKQYFKVNFYFQILDSVDTSIQERFHLLGNHEDTFGL